jgi:hypothetical protein
MSWHGYDITWSKEFKDYAFYALLQTNEAEIASEWLLQLYCSHESITPFDHDPTEAELEVYGKQVSALINKSKELKMIRKWFKHVQEANGHGDETMNDFRKDMKENYGVVIE